MFQGTGGWYAKVALISGALGATMELFMIKTGFCKFTYILHNNTIFWFFFPFLNVNSPKPMMNASKEGFQEWHTTTFLAISFNHSILSSRIQTLLQQVHYISDRVSVKLVCYVD